MSQPRFLECGTGLEYQDTVLVVHKGSKSLPPRASSNLEQGRTMETIRYVECDEKLRSTIGEQYGQTALDHIVLADGFTLVAMGDMTPVGFLAIRYRQLPVPLESVRDAMVWIIEVSAAHRRRGIASTLLGLASDRARAAGCHQLRAWSSRDKTAAIAMWKALGFGLCPATTHSRDREISGYFVVRVL